ncbi:MAG TPA: transglycosylase SLT domain-containing protein [Steroidobacteraceae bacterium]|jgi:membrane-bound lytic murein transglycosylase D|nr:transglycosylase SLT domain-containing protein [Steroidobacteraceae bacterium]
MNRLLLPGIVLLLLLVRVASAADTLLPRPPELEPDVQFWIRVYTQVSTNQGLIHDQHRLSVVYETLHFDADMPSSERARKVDFERERVQDILRHLARGDEPRDDDDRRVRKMWGDDATPAQLEVAAQDVRFQLGQSDRFRAGLIRSGAWEPHIAEVLANLGLPAEIAALPHVESSFDPYAYSKVGAAGLWQFMRSTGRRFLRIDAAVDERLDPYRETEAAAQLLSYNYRLLGSWPLAITAYNHGAEGVRRARELLGTDDIVRIVRDYHSPSFGFASRNFYVSFLAALSIAQDPDKYFGGVVRDREFGFRELKMPGAASLAALVRALGIDRETLHGLNPALRPAVWGGQRVVPAGYVLRLPAGGSQWTAELLAQRLGATQVITVAEASKPAKPAPAGSATAPASVTLPEVVVAAAAPGAASPAAAATTSAPAAAAAASSAPESSQYYVVQAGDNTSAIAERTGLPVSKIMTLNSMRDQDDIYEGEHLRLVAAAAEPETLTTRANVAAAQAAVQESLEENVAVAAASRLAARSEPVSMAQAQAEGPQLVPGATGPESADPEDYSVAADGSIRVVAAETLGHYADWLGTSAARLRGINHLHGRTPVVMGRRIKLEFDQTTHDQFEARRRDYHERLQAAYFASHRIAGTEVYIARRGDSLWSITQKSLKVPVWLLQQYNPDLDFRDLRPGTQISLPQVEDVSPL